LMVWTCAPVMGRAFVSAVGCYMWCFCTVLCGSAFLHMFPVQSYAQAEFWIMSGGWLITYWTFVILLLR
jgi:hypothetical protein